MNRATTVAATTSTTCVLIDYDTGRTELRPASTESTALAAFVVPVPESLVTWGTIEQRAALPQLPNIPLAWRVAALPAVALTAAVLVAGRRRSRFRRLIKLARTGRSLPPASEYQARYAVCAVRWAARRIPARWACLEESTSAAVLLTFTRRRAEWRHGIAMDPARLHAWIVGPDGKPVEEPSDTALYTATYTPDGPAGAGIDREPSNE